MIRSPTSIATRHGLVLQGVVRCALRDVGRRFVEDPVYDAGCERPDFLIPDPVTPTHLVEVHRTDIRNAFQMKLLRTLTAIAEAKTRFGPDLIAVQILLGDPAVLPSGQLRAIAGLFDATLLPRTVDPTLAALEGAALALARDPKSGGVRACVRSLAHSAPEAIRRLGVLLDHTLEHSRPRMRDLWLREAKRAPATPVPRVGPATAVKHGAVRALALPDPAWHAVRSGSVARSHHAAVVAAGAGVSVPTLLGPELRLEPRFSRFAADVVADPLRDLLAAELAAQPQMRWFFADLRDADRRLAMARAYLASPLDAALRLEAAPVRAIPHTRCWPADLLAVAMGVTSAWFNRRILADPRWLGAVPNPFDNLVIRSARLPPAQADALVPILCDLAVPSQQTAQQLADGLLARRLDGASKLQRLNPLHTLLRAACAELGLAHRYVGVPTLLTELGGAGVGRSRVHLVSRGDRVVPVALVAAHDGHGDDKSKEWGARRRAMRLASDGDVGPALFVVDGTWRPKDIARLHRSGWTHIVRPHGLRDALAELL